MLLSKLMKAGAAASLVLTCSSVNAQAWTSNSSYGLYNNQLSGNKGNVAIGLAASSGTQANRLTIKADSARNGLRIYNYQKLTKLLQCSNGGLTVGSATTAPANGLYVAGSSTFVGAGTFNNNLTVKSGLIVSAGLAKFNGPVSMNSTLITSGNATFNSAMTVVGKTTLAGGFNASGASTLNTANITTLNVSGVATFNGATTLNGNITGYGQNTFYNGMCIYTGSDPYNSIRIKKEDAWDLITAYGYRGYDPMAFMATKYNFRNGNVGIGVDNPTAKLHVAGKILCTGEIEVADVNSNTINVNSLNAKDIQMEMRGAADYVFENNYNLKSLSEVESYVNEHKHLPGMPSAAEMDANGVSVSQMSNLLLEKVEELTLHMIQLEKENAALKARVSELEK